MSAKQLFIIGERINPTGKKKLSNELAQGRMEELLGEARIQEERGVDALDVNVGVPGVDAVSLMKKAVAALVGNIRLPLVIDSAYPEVIEAGLEAGGTRVLMVSSVNAKESSLKALLPQAARAEVKVVGLLVNGKRMPDGVKERLEAAKKILEEAERHGIAKEKVILDPCLLPVKFFSDQLEETLETVRAIKKELGNETIVGLSNFSFRLSNRGEVNARCLEFLMDEGLDYVILNPLEEEVMAVARGYQRKLPSRGKLKEFFEFALG